MALRVGNLTKDLQHREKLLKRIGDTTIRLSSHTFRREADPYGNKWPALKRRKGRPLRDTGRLRNSLDKRVVGGTAVEVGTGVEYAETVIEGYTGPQQVPAHTRLIKQAFGKKLKFPVYVNVAAHTRQQNIPPRRVLPTKGLPKRWITAMQKDIAEYLAF